MITRGKGCIIARGESCMRAIGKGCIIARGKGCMIGRRGGSYIGLVMVQNRGCLQSTNFLCEGGQSDQATRKTIN